MNLSIKGLLLYWWHALSTVAGSLIEGLGLFALFLALVTYILRFYADFRRTRSLKLSLHHTGEFRRETVIYPAIVVLVLFLLGIVFLGPYKIDQKIEGSNKCLQNANRSLVDRNKQLTASLDRKTHSLDTTDPVFSNFIYLLQAFQQYRSVRAESPCLLVVTSPPDSEAIASVVAQFSNATSGCQTFGPMDVASSPDVQEMTFDGMVPGRILFHALRDDKSANILYGALGNQIQLRRSYLMKSLAAVIANPPKNGGHVVWLQFGTNVKWNSELNVIGRSEPAGNLIPNCDTADAEMLSSGTVSTMTPELRKEIIVGVVSVVLTALFTGVPAILLFWWTWRRDQERLVVQKIVPFGETFDGKRVQLNNELGILIRNRSLFPVHLSAMGFQIDGEVIQLKHPSVPVPMKRNPDERSNRPNIPNEDIDPWELKSLGSVQVSVFNPADLATLSSALQKAAGRSKVSVDEFVLISNKVVALVALETGRMFTSLPLRWRVWYFALRLLRMNRREGQPPEPTNS